MIVGLLFFVIGMAWWWHRQHWRPHGHFAPTPPAPLPMPLPAQPDGCWYEAVATLWFSHAGPLRPQGAGQLRCLGDQLQWLGHSGTLWIRWEGILALHGQPNGVLVHTMELPPLVLSVPDNARLHAWLTAWLAHEWAFDGRQWHAQ